MSVLMILPHVAVEIIRVSQIKAYFCMRLFFLCFSLFLNLFNHTATTNIQYYSGYNYGSMRAKSASNLPMFQEKTGIIDRNLVYLFYMNPDVKNGWFNIFIPNVF